MEKMENSEKTSNHNDNGSLKNNESIMNVHRRSCHIVKRDDFDGYGFNLHSEKGKPGQYIGKVDENSPAELAGLREGDRIIEVNGSDIGSETHKQVVQRIKAIACEVRLLVIDPIKEKDILKQEKTILNAIATTTTTSSGAGATIASSDQQLITSNGNNGTTNSFSSNDKSTASGITTSSTITIQSTKTITTKNSHDHNEHEHNEHENDTNKNFIKNEILASSSSPGIKNYKTNVEFIVDELQNITTTDDNNKQHTNNYNNDNDDINDDINNWNNNKNHKINLNTNDKEQISSDENLKKLSTNNLMEHHQHNYHHDDDHHHHQDQNNEKQSSKSSININSSPINDTKINHSANGNNNNNNNNNMAISTSTTTSTTTSNDSKKKSLDLPMTAAEMRAKLLAKKKYDPKNDAVDLRKKFEIVQKL